MFYFVLFYFIYLTDSQCDLSHEQVFYECKHSIYRQGRRKKEEIGKDKRQWIQQIVKVTACTCTQYNTKCTWCLNAITKSNLKCLP